ncbi:MAG TPA: type II secretion system F family protein [Tepidisphaeraceae bacterium]|nr:type II secretion system F family protein [Tepidisphaeraceae bacterium]
MLDEQTLFLACVVGAVALGAFFVAKIAFGKGDGKLRQRLSNRPSEVEAVKAETGAGRAKEIFQKIGTAAAKPFMPETREKMSALRRKLSAAGIYSPAAIRTVTGMKVIFLAVGVIGGYAVGMVADNLMLGLSLGGLVGYMGPSMWLKMAIKRQQRALDYALPDALDLMVVCIEAGLAVDAAMQRVGAELSIAHPKLARELEISHAETRLGVSRGESLRNLGIRTGNVALQSLASMLVQAERFGTSIANALRVHGDSLRNTRQMKAEEMAAKASVKMSFPLVLFIFPATFIVLAGPTVIGLMRSPMFNGD